MTENRSLDEFGGDSSDGGGEDGGAETADDAESVSEPTPESTEPDPERTDRDDVTPAVGTYRWDPDGVDCPGCGETVHRLWLDDDAGAQVCADCKDW